MSKILIVDDEPDILDSLRDYLEALEYDVTTVQAADSAMAILSKEQFDVLITDINMPGMNGVELLKAIKEEHPLLQVIMMTAYSTTDKVFESLRFGAADYILKPMTDMEQTAMIIDEAARRIGRWRRIFMSALSDKARAQKAQNEVP